MEVVPITGHANFFPIDGFDDIHASGGLYAYPIDHSPHNTDALPLQQYKSLLTRNTPLRGTFLTVLKAEPRSGYTLLVVVELLHHADQFVDGYQGVERSAAVDVNLVVSRVFAEVHQDVGGLEIDEPEADHPQHAVPAETIL